MINEKKIDFLVKQGFDREIINMLAECGVNKNILWFLSVHKKGLIESLNSEEIKMVNGFLEKNMFRKIRRT